MSFSRSQFLACFCALAVLHAAHAETAASPRPRDAEQQRIDLIARISRSAVCILTPDRAVGGSGVIIAPDGCGITNFHVVAPLLEKRRGLGGLSDGKTYPLEVLGIDPTGDVAMFRLTGRDRFEPAPLGDSDAVQVGDAAIALGNPFMLAEDYTPTATFGHITGMHRYQFGQDARSLVYTDCLQTDASINPGNSGGPLFDAAGRVIGINGRASFRKQDILKQRINVGVAYAVSVNQIKRFIPTLREGLLVEHGSLGGTVTDSPAGVVFDKLLRPSAASAAGVEIGDRLVEFDGRPITSANAFLNVLGVYPAGWPVTIVFARGDQHLRRQAYLDPLPVQLGRPWKKADPARIRSSATQAASEPEAHLSSEARRAKGEAREPLHRLANDSLRRIIDTVQPAIVKIYGGKLADRRGYATGVIVSTVPEVITPLSFLLDASDLRVVTNDGQVHSAQVTYRDEYRQLALLRIRDVAAPDDASQPSHKPLTIDGTLAPSAGDGVLVIGNPFKIAEGDEACTVGQGAVSGRIKLDANRPNNGPPSAYRGEVLIMDAMVSNTGSPGSAVIDLQGRWIGLVGEVLESRLTNTLLNYAYPVREVAAFLREAHAAPATKPSTPTAPTALKAAYHGIRLSRLGYRTKLPFVDAVARNSPAARAGLQTGDLIVSVNMTSISQSTEFDEICGRLHAGETLSLVVKRGETLLTPLLTLEEPPQ